MSRPSKPGTRAWSAVAWMSTESWRSARHEIVGLRLVVVGRAGVLELAGGLRDHDRRLVHARQQLVERLRARDAAEDEVDAVAIQHDGFGVLLGRTALTATAAGGDEHERDEEGEQERVGVIVCEVRRLRARSRAAEAAGRP